MKTTQEKKTTGEVLKDIAERHGGMLTPELVVGYAKPEKSPIHHLFEWDDSKAAAEYRIVQAREVIRRVKISYEVRGAEREVRAYVCVKPDAKAREEDDSRGIYVPLAVAASVPSYREQMVEYARRDAKAFQAKYSALSDVEKILAAIADTFA